MLKKLLICGAAILASANSFAGWEFRGEPNNWGITPLTFVGGDRHVTRQTFTASQDEFKIAKDGSWTINFPTQNFRVAPGKTYDITFFENTKTIQAVEVTSSSSVSSISSPISSSSSSSSIASTENWVFRGTPNNWGKTPMTQVGGTFVTCQDFGSNDPRFKVMNANKADWVEAFPAQDFRVTANTSFDITFTLATKAIQVTPRTTACGTTPSSSSSSSSSSSITISSSSSSSVAPTESWIFRGTPNNWGKTPMTQVGNVFVTCQKFGTDDPRFKIMNGLKADWVEAFPAQDFRVTANTVFDITFTSSTKSIQVTPRTTNCDGSTNVVLDTERSLYVRDEATFAAANFSFRSVLTQLANQFNAANPSETINDVQLFARMWDTQNPVPGFVAGGPKCTGDVNGFPHRCRTVEGIQAQIPLDFIDKYIPIGLVNRFDLRDKVNFSNCGENRIIFALKNNTGRNFIIFEAGMPNPSPGVAAGCAPIVNFWKNLSAENNVAVRAAALSNFYFNGIPGQNVRPVIDIRNYSAGFGQIRTNQFMESIWVLKEFNTAIEGGVSIIKPASVKANPFGDLFNVSSNDFRGSAFRSQFLANMGSLLINDLSTFSLTVQDNAHNNGQSHASGSTFENSFLQQASISSDASFRNAIQSRAQQLGSSLTTTQVLNRATAMTCGGCHEPSSFGLTSPNSVGNGQTWPSTLGFTHASEFTTNNKFDISPALINVFLPSRKADLESFINTLSAPASASDVTTESVAPATTVLTGKRSG